MISRNPDIMHGKPCVAGTRVTIASIASLANAGYNNIAILAEYPHLTHDEIVVAINYERSFLRKVERLSWRVRFRVAAILLGVPVEVIEEEWM